MIEQNVKALLEELKGGNAFGEEVTLVAATKTRTPDEINRAIEAGITDIGENRVQEFRDKYDAVQGARRHFIGHLQTNKVKYLVGKVHLIHSVDRDELAEEIARRSKALGLFTNVLVQVNVGEEASKGGYAPKEAWEAYARLREKEGLCVKGFMAMLPLSAKDGLAGLCDEMRQLYERARAEDKNVEHLSMGMSGDWRLCLGHGATMLRLGTAIFGEREYSK